ncbi:spherulin-2A isoform X2 [Manduca sexta]|nr:spherulin-2A isoform X2 [Manduca sexta]
MKALQLFLLLPMVWAKINVNLTGTFDEYNPDLKIYVTGEDIALISEEEIKYFGLTDDCLKLGVKEYFGKEPNDVYLKSPTPWGDLYESLQWQPIYRILFPKNGKIINMAVKNVTIHQQTIENHTKQPFVYNVGIMKTVENTVKSTWQNDGLTVIDDVSYDIDIDSAGTTSFGYTSKWGHDSEQGQFITIGKSELEISLKPHQEITAKLQATKVILTFEVEYTSFLSGYLATIFADSHKGHKFWGLDIGAIMERSNLKNELQSKEEVEFTFYINSIIIVHDKEYGVKLMDVSC